MATRPTLFPVEDVRSRVFLADIAVWKQRVYRLLYRLRQRRLMRRWLIYNRVHMLNGKALYKSKNLVADPPTEVIEIPEFLGGGS